MVNLTRGAWAGEMDKTSAITIFPGPIPQSPHDFSLSNAKKSRIKDISAGLDGIIGRHNATRKDESVLLGGLLLNRRCSRAHRIDEDFNFAAVTNLFTLAHANGHQATVVQFKMLNEVLANYHRPSLR